MAMPSAQEKATLRRHHHIDFSVESDLVVATLAAMGMGNKFIARRTHLTGGQINYRIQLAKRKLGFTQGLRVGFRNGSNRFASMVLDEYEDAIRRELKKEFWDEQKH